MQNEVKTYVVTTKSRYDSLSMPTIFGVRIVTHTGHVSAVPIAPSQVALAVMDAVPRDVTASTMTTALPFAKII